MRAFAHSCHPLAASGLFRVPEFPEPAAEPVSRLRRYPSCDTGGMKQPFSSRDERVLKPFPDDARVIPGRDNN
jgi:hypothetical protein